MAGPNEQRLRSYVDPARKWQVFVAKQRWDDGADRLMRVALAVQHARPLARENLGTHTADAADQAFVAMHDKVLAREAQMRAGGEALQAAIEALGRAEAVRDGFDAAGPLNEPSPPDWDEDEVRQIQQMKVHNAQVTSYNNQLAAREEAAAAAIRDLDETNRSSAETMRRIQGERPEGPGGSGDGGAGGTGGAGGPAPLSGGRTQRGGPREPQVTPVSPEPQVNPQVDPQVDPVTDPPTGVPDDPQPTPGETGTPLGPGQTGTPLGPGTGATPVGSPSTLAAPGASSGAGNIGGLAGAVGGGVAGGALGMGGAIRGGVTPTAAAGATRPIGASGRTASSGALGRGAAASSSAGRGTSARGTAARGAGATAGGANRGKPAGAGAGGRGTAGVGAGGRRDRGAVGGAGGRGGRRSENETVVQVEAIVDDQDWVDDEDAAPGVIS